MCISLISLLHFYWTYRPHWFMMQKYPPTSKFVRAVSILTGYFIKATGPTSCIFTYLSQADPKGQSTNTPLSSRTCFTWRFLQIYIFSSFVSPQVWFQRLWWTRPRRCSLPRYVQAYLWALSVDYFLLLCCTHSHENSVCLCVQEVVMCERCVCVHTPNMARHGLVRRDLGFVFCEGQL